MKQDVRSMRRCDLERAVNELRIALELSVRVQQNLAERVVELETTLKKVAQTHAWQSFGECRSFGSDVPLLTSREADVLAKEILGTTGPS